MIAQRLAISHSSRVRTLTSIMSSGYALNSRIVDKWGLKLLFRAAPFLLKNFNFRPKLLRMQPTVKSYLATYRRLAGRKYPFNADYFRALFSYAINERQGQNPRAIIQQFCAIAASGSRLSELQQIQAPTLVLHGTDDRLVPPTHAQLYAPLIPGVRVVWLDGVGHEMPHAVMPQVHEALFDLWK
jgi:pimeloyl-ACP methyl ester carboxylesterase